MEFPVLENRRLMALQEVIKQESPFTLHFINQKWII